MLSFVSPCSQLSCSSALPPTIVSCPCPQSHQYTSPLAAPPLQLAPVLRSSLPGPVCPIYGLTGLIQGVFLWFLFSFTERSTVETDINRKNRNEMKQGLISPFLPVSYVPACRSSHGCNPCVGCHVSNREV